MNLMWNLKNVAAKVANNFADLDYLIGKFNRRYVLAYHRIVSSEYARENLIEDSMWTSPETFEEQIKWMSEIGEIVDIRRLLNFKEENKRPLFSISFDDGWKDNYTYGFPILKKYKLNATIFIVTSAIENGNLLWPEEILEKSRIALKNNNVSLINKFLKAELGRLKMLPLKKNALDLIHVFLEYLKTIDVEERKRRIEAYYEAIGEDSSPINGFFLDWNDILEMDQYGINIGSHTHSHAIFDCCDSRTIFYELNESKRIIGKKLKKNTDLFCFPNARYNVTDHVQLQKAGYNYGFILRNLPLRKDGSRFFVPRVLMNESIYLNPAYFKFRLLSVPKY